MEEKKKRLKRRFEEEIKQAQELEIAFKEKIIERGIERRYGVQRILKGISSDFDDILNLLGVITNLLKKKDTNAAITKLKEINLSLPGIISLDLKQLLDGLEHSDNIDGALDYIEILKNQYLELKKEMEEKLT